MVDGLIQDKPVSQYVHPAEGNPDYVAVTANFPEPLAVDVALITNEQKIWTLTFELTDAVAWSDDPATLDTPQDLLAAFQLKLGPNQSTTLGRSDDGIRASLRIE